MGNEAGFAISPKEAMKRHIEEVIPKEVYDAVNQLLSERCGSGGSIVIKHKEITALAMRLLKEAGKEFEESDFTEKGWMDFEPHYREKGWMVKYDKPTYGDTSFDSYFTFTPKT